MGQLHILLWLLCAALVRGGFHYPHDVVVKDEASGVHQRQRRQQQVSSAKPASLRKLMGKKKYYASHHRYQYGYMMYTNNKGKGYQKGKGITYNKGQWKGNYNNNGGGEGPLNNRNWKCNAGNILPVRQNPGQCPYPMLESRDGQFEKQGVVNGLTYDDLAESHARWLFERDDYDSTSPVFDEDGSLNEQTSGVAGVHFLSPNGQQAACLTTAVSKNDIIFFDISTSIFVSFPSDTEEDWYGPLRSYASFAGYPDPMSMSNEDVTLTAARLTASFQQNLDMHVILDGCEVDPRHEYAVTETFILSDKNSFGCGTFGAAGGFYGAVGPLEAGVHFLRIVVRNQGINYASAPAYFTTDAGAVNTYDSDNVFRLIVS